MAFKKKELFNLSLGFGYFLYNRLEKVTCTRWPLCIKMVKKIRDFQHRFRTIRIQLIVFLTQRLYRTYGKSPFATFRSNRIYKLFSCTIIITPVSLSLSQNYKCPPRTRFLLWNFAQILFLGIIIKLDWSPIQISPELKVLSRYRLQ